MGDSDIWPSFDRRGPRTVGGSATRVRPCSRSGGVPEPRQVDRRRAAAGAEQRQHPARHPARGADAVHQDERRMCHRGGRIGSPRARRPVLVFISMSVMSALIWRPEPFGGASHRMRTWARSAAAASALAAVLLAAPPASGAPIDAFVRADFEFIRERLASTAAALPTDRYPVRTDPSGAWETTGPRYWTSGFFPATLWLSHAATGAVALQAQAEARLAALAAQKRDRSGNDQSFKLLGSFGRGYELTGRDRYRRE